MIPPDIGKLLSINEDKKTNKDNGETFAGPVPTDHLVEHETVHTNIKCLSHIHCTGKDFTAMSDKIVCC